MRCERSAFPVDAEVSPVREAGRSAAWLEIAAPRCGPPLSLGLLRKRRRAGNPRRMPVIGAERSRSILRLTRASEKARLEAPRRDGASDRG